MEQIIFPVNPEDYKKEIVSEIVSELKSSINHSRNTTSNLLSRKETATYLKIALSTLWRLTKENKIQAVYIGNRVFYKQEDIEKALIKIK